jgi:hypothetical protein
MNIWIGFAWNSKERTEPVFRWEQFKSMIELWIQKQRDYHGRTSSLMTNKLSSVRKLIRDPETDPRLRIACERFIEHYEQYLKPKG